MFAVPGWSVSADALKTQTSSALNTKKQPESISATKTEDSVKKSKKRKRGADADGVAITGANLAELWERHIEGKPGPTKGSSGSNPTTKGKKKTSGNRFSGDGENKRNNINDGVNTMDGKAEFMKRKTLKEKKRAKKALQQANGEITVSQLEVGKPAVRESTTSLEPAKQLQATSTVAVSPPAVNTLQRDSPATAKLTPLQSSMRQKLISSRFRYLNQTLYTTPSTSSYDLFTQNPTFFTEYHEGFRRQVETWPENPVAVFTKWILDRGPVGLKSNGLGSQKAEFRKNKRGKSGDKGMESEQKPTEPAGPSHLTFEPLPRHPRTNICTIADLGCGDAQLAARLSSPPSFATKTLCLKIHSFDLAAPSPLITRADIRAVPLAPASIDITIFSLALMGTNWLEFIDEAWRILRWKGECWIGEVGSRFVPAKARRVEHSVGNRSKAKSGKKGKRAEVDADEEAPSVVEEVNPAPQQTTDVSSFVEVLRTRGFVLSSEPELGNKMFVRMRFVKALTPTRGKGVPKENDAGGQAWGAGRKRFVEKSGRVDQGGEGGGEVSVEEEGRVLKPCVYKTR